MREKAGGSDRRGCRGSCYWTPRHSADTWSPAAINLFHMKQGPRLVALCFLPHNVPASPPRRVLAHFYNSVAPLLALLINIKRTIWKSLWKICVCVCFVFSLILQETPISRAKIMHMVHSTFPSLSTIHYWYMELQIMMRSVTVTVHCV